MDDYKPPPRNDKPKWAIVSLTKNKPVLSKRNTLLANVIRPYAAGHDITIIIFSEMKNFAAEVGTWQQQFAGIGKVKYVDTSTDGFRDPNGQWKYGYKYMCKFFMLDMYRYLHEYDYYLRVDSDDFFEKLTYDMFSWVEKNNVEYGWGARKIEGHGATRRTLPPWTAKYAHDCGIWPSALMDSPLNTCFNFYNNFHVGKVSFFLQPDVMHFLLAVNASGHVENHRWGDSSIQAYAVRLFMDPARIRMLPDLTFVHKSHNFKKITTFTKGVETLKLLPQSLPYWVHESHAGKDWL